MKKEYQEPNVEIVILYGQDVITGSPSCNGGGNETEEDTL